MPFPGSISGVLFRMRVALSAAPRADGLTVGSLEGESADDELDGELEGDPVDGELDGGADGGLIGDVDGELDGAADGELVGDVDGVWDGPRVGTVVGDFVFTTVLVHRFIAGSQGRFCCCQLGCFS